MAIYKVLATKEGLTLDYRYISKAAIATFPDAFKQGQPCHFGHPDEYLPYPPKIGTIVSTYNEDDYTSFADIDFTDEFARNFGSNVKYEVSVYAMARWHIDDQYILVLDAFLPSELNSIDVVSTGAVKGAAVLDGESKNEFQTTEPGTHLGMVRYSIGMGIEATDQTLQGKDEIMDRQEILDAIKEGLGGEAVTDVLMERITDAVTDIVSANSVPAAPPVDISKVAIEAFSAGATSGLDGKSVERVAALSIRT